MFHSLSSSPPCADLLHRLGSRSLGFLPGLGACWLQPRGRHGAGPAPRSGAANPNPAVVAAMAVGQRARRIPGDFLVVTAAFLPLRRLASLPAASLMPGSGVWKQSWG